MGMLANIAESNSPAPGRRWEVLEEVDYQEAAIEDAEDARTVVQLLEDIAADDSPPDSHELDHLATAASTFETVDSDPAFEVMAGRGLEELRRIIDRVYPLAAEAGEDGTAADAVLNILIVFAEYGDEEGASYIARALDESVATDRPGWWRISQVLAPDNPVTARLFDEVSSLPDGSAGVEFLSAANDLAAEDYFQRHPYDNEGGRERLAEYLESGDGQAVVAAEALRHLSDPADLVELAVDHPDSEVRLQAAGAGAAYGDEEALGELTDAAVDPARAMRALRILEDIGRLDAAPDESLTEDFLARAGMCQWLAHPLEMQRPPDSIERIDHRVEYWPPTDDVRPLWLFRYDYDGDDRQDEGVGMYGSKTFSLVSNDDHEDLEPEDIYALHCCYELIWADDPRAPDQPSFQAGRDLLDW